MKDSHHALEIICDFNFLGQNKLIFTLDATYLYTVIPNYEGLWALKHFSDQRTVKEPSSETLLRLAKLVLTFSCFSFGGNYYNQTNGVAMSTKIGLSYANLFAVFVMNTNFLVKPRPQPELYGRYIDDCIDTTVSTREELTQFLTAVISFHPALKYTFGNLLHFFGFSRHQNFNFRQRSVLQIHIITCYVHLYIHHTKGSPYLFHSSIRLRRLCRDNSDFSANLPIFRWMWLTCFFRSSGPPPRPTNWSTVSTTNGSEWKYWSHSSHISPS